MARPSIAQILAQTAIPLGAAVFGVGLAKETKSPRVAGAFAAAGQQAANMLQQRWWAREAEVVMQGPGQQYAQNLQKGFGKFKSQSAKIMKMPSSTPEEIQDKQRAYFTARTDFVNLINSESNSFMEVLAKFPANPILGQASDRILQNYLSWAEQLSGATEEAQEFRRREQEGINQQLDAQKTRKEIAALPTEAEARESRGLLNRQRRASAALDEQKLRLSQSEKPSDILRMVMSSAEGQRGVAMAVDMAEAQFPGQTPEQYKLIGMNNYLRNQMTAKDVSYSETDLRLAKDIETRHYSFTAQLADKLAYLGVTDEDAFAALQMENWDSLKAEARLLSQFKKEDKAAKKGGGPGLSGGILSISVLYARLASLDYELMAEGLTDEERDYLLRLKEETRKQIEELKTYTKELASEQLEKVKEAATPTITPTQMAKKRLSRRKKSEKK